MIIETPLYYKSTDWHTERCQVDEVVTLGQRQFEYLKNCTLEDFDFIEELRDKLPVSNDNTRHCIMALDETGSDGILIDPQGFTYPRYSAYIPNAKQLLQMERYQSLKTFNQDMMDTVKEVAQLALNSQEYGSFCINLESAEEDFYPNILDKTLLIEMLSNRPEFKELECKNGDLLGNISDEYKTEEVYDEESGMSM